MINARNRSWGIAVATRMLTKPEEVCFFMRNLIIMLSFLVPVAIHGEPSGYTGVWLNKKLFDNLASGVEPKVALEDCGDPTAITFLGGDELMISWNNHDGVTLPFRVLEDGSIETMGNSSADFGAGMKYRILITGLNGGEVLSVHQLVPVEKKQDDMVRYPEQYGTYRAPQGMIISLFLAGDYSLAGHPDSTISIRADGSVEGWNQYDTLTVGFDCVEEGSQNHVYLFSGNGTGGYPPGDSFVWEQTGDTLSLLIYQWEGTLFNGTIGEESLRLIRK